MTHYEGMIFTALFVTSLKKLRETDILTKEGPWKQVKHNLEANVLS